MKSALLALLVALCILNVWACVFIGRYDQMLSDLLEGSDLQTIFVLFIRERFLFFLFDISLTTFLAWCLLTKPAETYRKFVGPMTVAMIVPTAVIYLLIFLRALMVFRQDAGV